MASRSGRFAPSPTGPLHLGNLRTALVAWLRARHEGSPFLLRIEDLDRGRSRPEHEAGQLADLRAIGIDWDGEPIRQATRDDAYAAALTPLQDADLVYPCWCTRAEIRDAASAAHDDRPENAYPGTCARLDARGRADKARSGRPAALRVRAESASVTVDDVLLGPITGIVDDFVVRRGDGTFAYNLAVVVDDGWQRIDEVVRGDDLASSAPRQRWLADRLGLPRVGYVHVPLVLGPDGRRLAKRDGAVTLADRLDLGETADQVRGALAASLGLCSVDERPSAEELVERFAIERLVGRPATVWNPGAEPLGATG